MTHNCTLCIVVRMSEEKKPTYFTSFLVAEKSSPNHREGNTYLTNVVFTKQLGDIPAGEQFPWVVMYYNIHINEVRLECYRDFTDYTKFTMGKAVKYRGPGL